MEVVVQAPTALFDRIVAETGVSALLARAVIRTSLAQAGADPVQARPSHYREVLGTIEDGLAAYLPRMEVERRRRAIELVLHEWDPAA